MKIIDSLLAKVGLQRTRPARLRRDYHGADRTRITADWDPPSRTGDMHIRDALCTMIARSRKLERDNDYARRFLNALENNVLGADGFHFQNKARLKNGGFDKIANDKIEEAWSEWCKKKYCTLNGEDAFVDVQRLALRSAARDGGIFIRPIEGADNEFGFTLELIEVDHLDVTIHGQTENGNRVFMGVERNPSNRVVAYHMLKGHPGDIYGSGRERIRVPANQLIHYFVKERITQSVGVPWFTSAMSRLYFLEKYEEAEVLAARAGAEKGGWFQSERGDQFEGDQEVSADGNGTNTVNTYNDFEPGSFDELPPGMTFHEYNPTHPNQAYEPFVRGVLYGISAGLNIDYATLTGDLSKANYSSMRSGKLESQEAWKGIQGHMVRNLILDVFERWLGSALLTGAIDLPFIKMKFFNKPQFRGRRWPWVDPTKDVTAAVQAIQNGLDTHTNVVAQSGGDFEDVIETKAQEKEIAKQAGFTLADLLMGAGEAAPQPAPEDEQDEGGQDMPTSKQNERNIQDLKMKMDAYGVGVRAGAITPTRSDEEHFRAAAGLPPLTQEAEGAWTEDGGVRRPITLVQKGGSPQIGPPAPPADDSGQDMGDEE